MSRSKYYTETYAVIYILTDRDDNVFYVGCTIQQLRARLAIHFADAKATNRKFTNRAKNEKIRSLDFDVRIKEVERVKAKPHKGGSKGYYLNAQGRKREHYWIRHFHRKGARLTNNKELIDALKA